MDTLRRRTAIISAFLLIAGSVCSEPQTSVKPVARDSSVQQERQSDYLRKQIELKVKTVYSVDGRPVNQALDAKGYHRITDSVKLVAGRANITLNTSTSDGKQDVSFLSWSTYAGQAWSRDTLATNTYQIIQITGSRFVVKSSDSADTSTVYFRVEGE